MAAKKKIGVRYELVIEVGDITVFRLRVFESDEDRLGYFLTSKGKRSTTNPLVIKALNALSDHWPQADVEMTVDDDRQITAINGS